MMKSYETLLTAIAAPHVLLVTLNRPDVANALNTQMGRDLLDLWTGLIAEPGESRQPERSKNQKHDDQKKEHWKHLRHVTPPAPSAANQRRGRRDRC